VTPPQASAAQPVMVVAAQPKVLALQLPFQGRRLPLLQNGQEETRTISYVYDELYRLTEANYSDGAYFHYTYDANGNRTSETTPAGTLCSYYDIANKLTAVYANGQNTICPAEAPQGSTASTWDANGNLLSDGTYTYTYDRANRLKTVTQGTNTTSMVYNGLGDRVQETVNEVTTTFALDLNTGLTQVLQDGTNTYLYGNGRIGQFTASDSAYFLGDALGSVRQLVDGSGEVILVKDYEPYGEVIRSVGESTSRYGFTAEMQSSYIKLLYLRSRYYSLYLFSGWADYWWWRVGYDGPPYLKYKVDPNLIKTTAWQETKIGLEPASNATLVTMDNMEIGRVRGMTNRDDYSWWRMKELINWGMAWYDGNLEELSTFPIESGLPHAFFDKRKVKVWGLIDYPKNSHNPNYEVAGVTRVAYAYFLISAHRFFMEGGGDIKDYEYKFWSGYGGGEYDQDLLYDLYKTGNWKGKNSGYYWYP